MIDWLSLAELASRKHSDQVLILMGVPINDYKAFTEQHQECIRRSSVFNYCINKYHRKKAYLNPGWRQKADA